jgi:hypothetical protein
MHRMYRSPGLAGACANKRLFRPEARYCRANELSNDRGQPRGAACRAFWRLGRVLSEGGLRTRGSEPQAYVYQGRVERYGWLTGSQMIDGLAPPRPARFHRGGLRGLHRRLSLGSLRPQPPLVSVIAGPVWPHFWPSFHRLGAIPPRTFLLLYLTRPEPMVSPPGIRPALPVRHLKPRQPPRGRPGSAQTALRVLTLSFRLCKDTIRTDGA